MEASALTRRAPARGFLARRSPLLRLESDERLVELIRAGHDGAFEALFNRYNGRLLGFCQSMLKSRQDAEDVLQEVFANAHSAMLKDDRAINVRPWLYRIARNRCLNHLRRPVPEGQDSMDVLPHANGTTTAEHVQMREDLRQLMADVGTLPETQRTALLLREVEQLSYEEIAQAMQTTVPSIKSLLVRARIGLAESGQARLLTCEEVQIDLAEAAEGIGKLGGPARKHVRDCEGCKAFRGQLRSDRKALAAAFPVGLLAVLKHGALAKLFGGGSVGAAGSGAASAGAVGGASATGGIGLLGGAIGAKAAAGFATAAILTAGAVEVRNLGAGNPDSKAAPAAPAAVAPELPKPIDAPARFAARVESPPAPARSVPARPAPADDQRPREAADAARPTPPTPPAADPATTPKPEAADPVATTGPEGPGVAVGTTAPPTTGSGGQDTGSAPAEPPVTAPTTPTVPTTTDPTPPPPVAPTPPPVAPAPDPAPATPAPTAPAGS
ncbi:MAG: RNA polymerase sigma factor [Solirubrobacterales bacterium]